MTQDPSVLPLLDFHALIARSGSKEGARDLFEDLIVQMLRLRHPGARRIDPAPGDWGLDAIVGELDEITAVWQAKFFIDGVGESQRQQIRDAMSTLVKASKAEGFTVSAWTLCVPISFDAETTKWWDGYRRRAQRQTGVKIELWDETELRGQLMAPEAANLVAQYFTGQSAPKAAAPVLDLLDPTMFDDALFVAQLEEARLKELSSAKREFFNAQVLRRDVLDKNVPSEVVALNALTTTLHALWEHRFNAACAASADGYLPGFHSVVMTSIEAYHVSSARVLPASLVHVFGLMHRVVEEGRAGWVQHFREIAGRYGR